MSTAPLPLSAFVDVLPRYPRELREEISATTDHAPDQIGGMIEDGTTRRTRGVRLRVPNASHLDPGLSLDLIVVSVYLGRHVTGEMPGNGALLHRVIESHKYAVIVADPSTGESISTSYSEGTAHRAGLPDAADIVAALLTDAGSVLPYLMEVPLDAPASRYGYRPAYEGSWRDWAADLGLGDDPTGDPRQAFRACTKTANRLRAMLGAEDFAAAVEIAGQL